MALEQRQGLPSHIAGLTPPSMTTSALQGPSRARASAPAHAAGATPVPSPARTACGFPSCKERDMRTAAPGAPVTCPETQLAPPVLRGMLILVKRMNSGEGLRWHSLCTLGICWQGPPRTPIFLSLPIFLLHRWLFGPSSELI